MNFAIYDCIQNHAVRQALLMGWSGDNKVSFQVTFFDIKRRAHHLELLQSTGHTSLDRAILHAARTCHWPEPPAGYAKHRLTIPIEMG
ncbi:MAG: energy transducer TonB family protein [Gammaproteobacteria bacterium]